MIIGRRREKILGIHEQLARMKAFPGFRAWIRGAELIAEGDIQPSPLSVKYRVRLTYQAGHSPRVEVIDPPLVLRPGSEKLPHVHREGDLCLFLPDSEEWRHDLSLPHTIIPWASLWLFNYEFWHATGEWHGGGLEPPPKGTFRKGRGDGHGWE